MSIIKLESWLNKKFDGKTYTLSVRDGIIYNKDIYVIKRDFKLRKFKMIESKKVEQYNPYIAYIKVCLISIYLFIKYKFFIK